MRRWSVAFAVAAVVGAVFAGGALAATPIRVTEAPLGAWDDYPRWVSGTRLAYTRMVREFLTENSYCELPRLRTIDVTGGGDSGVLSTDGRSVAGGVYGFADGRFVYIPTPECGAAFPSSYSIYTSVLDSGSESVVVGPPEATNIVTILGRNAVSPDGGKVVYMNPNSSGTQFAWVANTSGVGSPINLGREASSAAWSPDGSKIALSAWGRVTVINADGTGARDIAVNTFSDNFYSGSEIAWSPDGSTIAVAGQRSNPSTSWGTEYVLRFLDPAASCDYWTSICTGRPAQTIATDPVFQLTWSPDSTRLAMRRTYIVDNGDGSFHNDEEIAVVSWDGSAFHDLVPVAGDASYSSSPAWSPDGTKLAFSSTRDQAPGDEFTTSLYIVDVEPGLPKPAAPHSTTDRPDDTAGSQIHVVYAIPSDGVDRELDLDGTLANSVAAFQAWLEDQTGGRALRLDTFEGDLDVTFIQLSRTDEEIAEAGAFVRDVLEEELEAAGSDEPNKIYAVYYDGTSTFSCGGGAWPPTLEGNVAAMYLNGLPDGPVPCSSNPFAGPGDPPAYMEFAMLHEIMHTLGFVPACAPNHHRSGHVSDEANDLMWAGDGPWVPSGWGSVVLDAGYDDYYAHGSACLNFDDSPFLSAAPDGDADGIGDGVDTGNGTFSDGQGTTGSIVSTGGLIVQVSDARAPDGVRITTAGAGGDATLRVCGFTLRLAAGSDAYVTCGSLRVAVTAGRAVIDLGNGITTITVGAGVEAKVTDTGSGTYSVQNLGGGIVTVTVDGVATTLAAGQTQVAATWDFQGFSAPVDNRPFINVMKAGQAVPLKWRVLNADGTPKTNLLSAKITVATLACSSEQTPDAIEETATGASGLQNLGNGYYQLNWATPKNYANSCKTLKLDLGEGVTRDAFFKFTK